VGLFFEQPDDGMLKIIFGNLVAFAKSFLDDLMFFSPEKSWFDFRNLFTKKELGSSIAISSGNTFL